MCFRYNWNKDVCNDLKLHNCRLRFSVFNQNVCKSFSDFHVDHLLLVSSIALRQGGGPLECLFHVPRDWSSQNVSIHTAKGRS